MGLSAFLIPVSPALAVDQNPQWTVTAVSMPTNFTPGDGSGEDSYRVTVTNTGGAASNGSPISIADQLPVGLSLAAASASGEDQLTHKPLTCVALTCTYKGTVVPEDSLTLTVPVDVEIDETTSVTNAVTASGGGGAEATTRTPTAISPSAAEFGIAPGGASTALSSLQAGAHADLTSVVDFDTINAQGTTAGDPKDATVELPPGFAGDLPDTPSCSAALFSRQECPIATQVGVTTLNVNLGSGPISAAEPLYHLAPGPGEVAKIGFHAVAFSVVGDVALRPGGSGLQTSIRNIPGSSAQLDGVSFTVWGVPASPLHNPMRWNPASGEFGASTEATPAAYFTNPTSCSSEPLRASVSIDSWESPTSGPPTEMTFGPLEGCQRLVIEPTLSAQPSTTEASSATGLGLSLSVPQTYQNPEGLATPEIESIKAAMPEGVSLNPSAGAGLGACTPTQYAQETLEIESDLGCPSDSRVGTVRIKSPALAEEATGALFLAKPFENPSDSLLALYLVARIPDRGVLVKAAGKITPDPASGRLMTTFDGLPQVPFSELSLSFRQGATSPLISPPRCGEFDVRASLTPSSDPLSAVAVAAPFQITEGPGGGTCPAAGPAPFNPRVSAGTLNNNAGVYSTLFQEISRGDGEGEITHFATHYPRGLAAKLAGVPFCSNAAIEAARALTAAAEEANPSCSPASQIGHTLVGAGVGSVLSWAPGRLYLAGPYDGAQLSTVAITAARVGPFDLGTVVIRTTLRIDPETGRATVDSSSSAPFPQIIDGIPLHIRDLQVYVDRPEFIINPTSCEPFSIGWNLAGAGAGPPSTLEDVSSTAANPFQVAGCAALPFAPRLSFTVRGGSHRDDHPSFSSTFSASPGEANVAVVQVTLPRTEFIDQGNLRNVCTRVQFAKGSIPGEECPSNSVYGHTTAVSPLLSEPLEGSVFLRSSDHQLPDLVISLHNSEIQIVLDGHVDSVHGHIRNTFEAIPDAPVSSVTLTMPGGSSGLLVNAGNICDSRERTMVRFTAQNGKTATTAKRFMPPSCAKAKKIHRTHKAAAISPAGV
ncbi:MAG: hypothetical protein WB507_06460 [Solirubrobacterales bacterium]